MLWIVLFYLFCFLCIAFVTGFIHLLTHPSFRDEIGDISTEAGYEEDPTGKIIGREFHNQGERERADPHVMPSANSTSGPM